MVLRRGDSFLGDFAIIVGFHVDVPPWQSVAFGRADHQC